MTTENRKYLFRIMWIAAFVIIVASFFNVGVNIYFGWKSEKWPTVGGKVVVSEINRYHRGAAVTIRYEYSLLGRLYTSHRVAFYDRDFISWVNKYPEGRSITVYFDPDFPARSVLEPGAFIKTALSGEFASVITGCSVLILLLITGYGRKWVFPLK